MPNRPARAAGYIAGLPEGPIRVVGFLVDLNTCCRSRSAMAGWARRQTPEGNPGLGSGSCHRPGGARQITCAISATALRLGYLHPVARTSNQSTGRHPKGFYRSLRWAERFICPAPAGSGWTRPRDVLRRRAAFAVRRVFRPSCDANFRAGRAGQCRFSFSICG